MEHNTGIDVGLHTETYTYANYTYTDIGLQPDSGLQ